MKSFAKHVSWISGLSLMAFAASSCVTYPEQRARTAMQEREDILLVREDMRRLAGRIEGVELELERLQRDLASLRADQQRTVDTQWQASNTRLTALERRIQEVDAAREGDKKEIVARLSQTIEQLMASQTARSGTPRGTRRAGYGYEHRVGPGETLSHIAAAYGVTTRVIIEANELRNPDVLRVGQVLFIPE